MTRRERLMATLRGERVDRPPVSFYEIDGSQDMQNLDPFNIYSHPSWRPLIELARERTDRIFMGGVAIRNGGADPMAKLAQTETVIDAHGSRLTTTTIRAGRRILTRRTRRDPDVNTIWTLEHLLKDVEDAKAWLDLPEQSPGGEPDTAGFLASERALGDSGIAMIDTGDPLCAAAAMFEMGQFTVVAMTEPTLFHRLLERIARRIHWQTEAIARALPGRPRPRLCADALRLSLRPRAVSIGPGQLPQDGGSRGRRVKHVGRGA